MNPDCLFDLQHDISKILYPLIVIQEEWDDAIATNTGLADHPLNKKLGEVTKNQMKVLTLKHIYILTRYTSFKPGPSSIVSRLSECTLRELKDVLTEWNDSVINAIAPLVCCYR